MHIGEIHFLFYFPLDISYEELIKETAISVISEHLQSSPTSPSPPALWQDESFLNYCIFYSKNSFYLMNRAEGGP